MTIGAVCLGAVVPFTLIVILPTNKQLLDPALDPRGPLAGVLLLRWGRLHAIRSVLSALAFSLLLMQLNDVLMEARSQMAKKSTNEASIPNPALASFGKLVGEWTTVGSHGLVPDTTFHGHATFEWLEGGAFLIMHSEIDEPDIPSAVAVFGSDDSAGEYSMLYFDERGVSRRFEVTLSNNLWTWSRRSPGFSQRVTLTIGDDGKTIVSKGELSKDGISWEKDLDLIYTRTE